jgi:hypothetical protein
VTFEDLANRYLNQGKVNGLRAKSLARYGAVRDHFQAFLTVRGLSGADVQSLTTALIEDFKVWRATTPLKRNGWPVETGHGPDAAGAAPKTIQLEVQTIGTFFNHGLRLKLMTENPVATVHPVRLGK